MCHYLHLLNQDEERLHGELSLRCFSATVGAPKFIFLGCGLPIHIDRV